MNQTAVTIGTYNILNPYHAVKWGEKAGLNEEEQLKDEIFLKDCVTAPNKDEWRRYSNWDTRKYLVAKNIAYADIVCLQEVARETIADLKKIQPKRELAITAYHQTSSPASEFGNAIVYNPDKARLLKAFEIKHTIEKENGSETRSASCAVFDIAGKIIKVASVHLSGYNPTEENLGKKQDSKLTGYQELQTYAEALDQNNEEVDCVVIAGDFNEDQSEQVYDLYRPGFLQTLEYRNDGNYETTEPAKDRRIDWLFCKTHGDRKISMTPKPYEIELDQASDHLMTATEFRFFS